MTTKYKRKPKVVSVCLVCHNPFTMNRSDHRYCSNNCRQAGHRNQDPQQRALTPAEFQALNQQYKELSEKWRKLMDKSPKPNH